MRTIHAFLHFAQRDEVRVRRLKSFVWFFFSRNIQTINSIWFIFNDHLCWSLNVLCCQVSGKKNISAWNWVIYLHDFLTFEGVHYTILDSRVCVCYVTSFAWNRQTCVQSCVRAYNWCAELVFICPHAWCVCATTAPGVFRMCVCVCVCNKRCVDAQTGLVGSCTHLQQQHNL